MPVRDEIKNDSDQTPYNTTRAPPSSDLYPLPFIALRSFKRHPHVFTYDHSPPSIPPHHLDAVHLWPIALGGSATCFVMSSPPSSAISWMSWISTILSISSWRCRLRSSRVAG